MLVLQETHIDYTSKSNNKGTCNFNFGLYKRI